MGVALVTISKHIISITWNDQHLECKYYTYKSKYKSLVSCLSDLHVPKSKRLLNFSYSKIFSYYLFNFSNGLVCLGQVTQWIRKIHEIGGRGGGQYGRSATDVWFSNGRYGGHGGKIKKLILTAVVVGVTHLLITFEQPP